MNVRELTITDFISSENVLFERKYATAYYSEKLKLVGVVWHGSFNEEEYISFFNNLLDGVEGKPVVGFYSDIRKQGIVPISARKEFEKNFSPRGTKMGMDKTGVVTDASPFKKYYLNTIVKITKRPVKLTSNPDEALHYILEDKL